MTTAELLNPNAAEHPNMEGDSQMLQDFYIISKEPDTGPIVVGMVLIGGFSALSLFIAMLPLLTILLEGFSMIFVFFPFLVIPFFLFRHVSKIQPYDFKSTTMKIQFMLKGHSKTRFGREFVNQFPRHKYWLIITT